MSSSGNLDQPVASLASAQAKVTVAQPVAGAEWSYAIPAATWNRLITGFATLTTAVAVANRFPGLKLTDGVDELGELQETTAITASLTQKVTYTSGRSWQSVQGGTPGTTTVAIIMPALILPPGYVLSSSTPGIQAADQYSAVKLLFEQWTVAPSVNTFPTYA